MNLSMRRTVLHPGFNPARLRYAFLGWADRLTGADDDAVSSWTDLSGFGRNAVQATEGNQPNLKLAAMNGRNAVRFTGANADRVVATIPSTAAPYACVIVANVTTPVAATSVMLSGTNFIYQSSTTPTHQAFAGATLSGATVTNTPIVSIIIVNGTSSVVMNNGSLAAGNAGTLALVNLSIGSTPTGVTPTSKDTGFVAVIPNLRLRAAYALRRFLRCYYGTA